MRCQTKHEIKVGSKSGHVCKTFNHVASRKEHLLKHFNTKKHKEAEAKGNIAHVSNHISGMPAILDERVDVIDDQQRILVDGIEELKNISSPIIVNETADEIDNLSQAIFVGMVAVNGPSTITFECPRCGRKFNSNDEINEHDEFCIIANGIAIDKEMIPIIVSRFKAEVAAALVKHIENSSEIEWLQPDAR